MKIRIGVETGAAHSRCEETIEIPDERLDRLRGMDREAVIQAIATEHMMRKMVGWNWEEVKG